MKYLHLCPDDKFIRFVQDSFEAIFPGQNRYVVWGSDKLPRRSGYARTGADTKFVNKLYGLSPQYVRDLQSCSAVIVHCMTPEAALCAVNVPRSVPVVWSGWGYDYYDLIKLEYGGVLEGTRSLGSGEASGKKRKLGVAYVIRGLERRLFGLVYKRHLEDRVLRRADFFSAPIRNDWDLLRRARPDLSAEYVQLNYGSVDSMFKVGPDWVTGDDILVGNSASETNNHVEAFQTLANLDLGERRIVVPLSYGSEVYTRKIVELGRRMFGDRFMPLLDFMPLEKYNEVIANCSVVLMNHVRQQALGNVNIMLYKGARVFLRRENPIYDFLTSRGAVVFPVDTLSSSSDLGKGGLDTAASLANRQVIDDVWGERAVQSNLRSLGARLDAFGLQSVRVGS